jgi:hypothetical protein
MYSTWTWISISLPGAHLEQELEAEGSEERDWSQKPPNLRIGHENQIHKH